MFMKEVNHLIRFVVKKMFTTNSSETKQPRIRYAICTGGRLRRIMIGEVCMSIRGYRVHPSVKVMSRYG